MSVSSSNISTVHRLAKRLEKDIRQRELKVGDRYLTAHQAADMLGVSRASAQRAMKVLGDSQTLLRRRSLGTFVGPGAVNPSTSKVRTVFILTPERMHNALQVMASWMLRGVQRETGCTNISFGIVPQQDGPAYVNQLIKSSQESAELAGFIAAGCPREIYQLLADRGVPALVFGSLYQDTKTLPSIDLDNREAARLLTRYLVDRGHKRMMLLTVSGSRPGDYDFVDGVSDVLTEAGLPANALAMRVVPDDQESSLPVVRQLLQNDNCPSSLIVRGSVIVKAAERVLSDMGLKSPGDMEMVYQSVEMESEKSPRHPHIVPQCELEEIARMLGHMLKQKLDGQTPKMSKVVVPVQLCEIT